MSKQLELIRQIKSEMFLLSHAKMREVKEIIFDNENNDNVVFVLVQNRYGEIYDMPVKKIIWDEKTQNINIELFFQLDPRALQSFFFIYWNQLKHLYFLNNQP